MEDSVKQRLITFLRYKDISTLAFEKSCGMANGYVNSIRKGIGGEKLKSITLNYPELNREWLLYGEGSMLNEGYTTFEPVGLATPTAPNLENEIKILQTQLELKDKLIDSLQAEVNTLKDMNKQLLQAITKSIESNTQQKSV